MHSSQRFSLDPVLEVAVELASEVATPAAVDVGAAKLETAPKGPVSNDNLVNLVRKCTHPEPLYSSCHSMLYHTIVPFAK